MPFGAIHAGSSLLARQHRGILCLSCYARWLISFGSSAQRYIVPFSAMHYGSSLLTGGQQRGIISPFGAMHAGSSLLARQHRGILCLSVLCTLAHLFWLVSTEVYYAFRCYARWLISFGSSAQRYIMPFGAMHYGSPLLISGQQRGTTSPFGAMHVGSSLLARQHRGILCLSVLCTLAHLFWLVNTEVYYAFRCYVRWLILDVLTSFGASLMAWHRGIPHGLAPYRGKM
ncbi:hypothetical protein Tco_1097446 [Tanacetum coccineum]